MNTDNTLSRHVHSFFQDYLERQRDLSPNTILSYRDTLKLFLQFASRHLGKPVVDLSLELLEVELVLLFLDQLEAQRNNSAATRNVRLAALHTFFRYVRRTGPAPARSVSAHRRHPAQAGSNPSRRLSGTRGAHGGPRRH